ncbi:MAG: Holliday junction resolvase RuvX [Acidobacteria bacterium]|nr:Holliday junction resolvase RuvX [Acidobacteriota bacterium]
MGLDVGVRRIGMAISDATATLARPLAVLRPAGLEADAPQTVATKIAGLRAEDDDIATLVVGLPTRLDGSENEMTPRVRAFAAAIAQLTGLPVVFQDERLTSREAESRLALTRKGWRARKTLIDAAAAAIILQDYLDAVASARPVAAMRESDS